MAKAKKVEVETKSGGWCCVGGSGKRGFPTFAVIVLLIGISWLLNDLGILAFKIPWLPIILIVIASGWIADRYKKK